MTASPTPAELTALRVANAAVRNSPSPNSHIVDTVIFALGQEQLLRSPAESSELDRLRLLMNAQPAELTGQQTESLIDVGNGALSDYYHERQCHCSEYPAGCVTNPGYRKGAGHWDTDAFAIGLPAVIGLWEAMRNDRHAAKAAEPHARVAELETADGSPWQRAVAGLNALVDADVAFHVEPDGRISGPFGDEHIEWDQDASRWRLVQDDDDETVPALSGALLGRLGDPEVDKRLLARVVNDDVPAVCCGHAVGAHRPGGCIADTVRTGLIGLCGCLVESASHSKGGA